MPGDPIRKGNLDREMYRGKMHGSHRGKTGLYKARRRVWNTPFLHRPQKEPA